MLDLVTFAVPLLVLGTLYCLYRAVTLFIAWRPAAAMVRATDYGEVDQVADRWNWGVLHDWRLIDGEDVKRIDETVSYQDENGDHHVAAISRYVQRGARPDTTHLIWYDCANPGHATAFGPGFWLMIALGLVGALVLLFRVAFALHL